MPPFPPLGHQKETYGFVQCRNAEKFLVLNVSSFWLASTNEALPRQQDVVTMETDSYTSSLDGLSWRKSRALCRGHVTWWIEDVRIARAHARECDVMTFYVWIILLLGGLRRQTLVGIWTGETHAHKTYVNWLVVCHFGGNLCFLFMPRNLKHFWLVMF